MTRFSYTVKDASSKKITGSDDAPDEASLIARLQKQGFYIVSIAPFSETLQTKIQDEKKSARQFTHKKVTLNDLLVFCHQLSTMLDAGVTLLRSLNIIALSVESEQFADVLAQVKKDVEQGSSLSQSLAKHPKAFDQFWVSLAEVGEASGTMPSVLEKLAFYLERRAEFQRSLVSATLYPAILFMVAVGAISFFALFVGPRFKSIFSQMDMNLPMITKILLNTFDFIKTKFLVIVGGIGAILFMLVRYIRTPAGMHQKEVLLLSAPTVGKVYRTIIVERFCSQMSILVESGVPILYALDITQRLIGNSICHKIIGDVKNSVREGKLIAEPMAKSHFFPPLAVQMIMIGEETGELSKMLKKVSEFYQTSVETFMERFGSIFEPLMIVFMAFVIGAMVLAMFLPILNMATMGM